MNRRTIFGLLISLLLIVAAVPAQDRPAEEPQPQPAEPTMSMQDMMQRCREHCAATRSSIDNLLEDVEAAARSNDRDQMRTTLEAVQQPLTRMRDHMNMCMMMMNMMERMGNDPEDPGGGQP